MFIVLMEDLRFIIGLFFGVISVILILAGLIGPSDAAADFNLNLIVGGYIGCFSLVMLVLGIRSCKGTRGLKNEDVSPELSLTSERNI